MLQLIGGFRCHGGIMNNSVCWRWFRESGSGSDSSFTFRHQLDLMSSHCGTSMLKAILIERFDELRREFSWC